MMIEAAFYQRQSILSQIGDKGQAHLKAAPVVIIGAGGLGHPVASFLAAAGVGRILIVDDDTIDGGNLNRQFLFTPEQIGENKSEVLRERIQKQNPFIQVNSLDTRVSLENCQEILSDYKLVLDCTDNFKTKFLLHDACFLLKKDLIQASIYQFEGQLQNFLYSNDEVRENGCLRCLWPEVPSESCVGNCEQAGVVGAVAGNIGTMQAMEAIKSIVGMEVLTPNTTLTFDLISYQLNKFKWKKYGNCPLCADSSVSLSTISRPKLGEFEILASSLSQQKVIDVRNSTSMIEFSDVVRSSQEKNTHIVFVCNKGIQSLAVTRHFRALGFSNTWSLFEGLSGLDKDSQIIG
ncbi:hypothetical protein A9Q84_12530 [Halobacteriovorax marinus]|uniref:Rhodanese domain-containing protein n=1 Tax=Halobacteriovorax marinus TaxID=97084 RepID=A0A1Y5F897_9BACT|nr:hypothetical protein A9Q84_12530 [Halobacteriovorax marinus]